MWLGSAAVVQFVQGVSWELFSWYVYKDTYSSTHIPASPLGTDDVHMFLGVDGTWAG